MSAAKIKKGDKVVILSGKDKGKHGEVTKAMPSESKVIVGGINMMTRHKKPSQQDPNGGLVRMEAPMHVSKVAIEDPKTGKPTRVGFKFLDDGRKVRFAKRSGEVIDAIGGATPVKAAAKKPAKRAAKQPGVEANG